MSFIGNPKLLIITVQTTCYEGKRSGGTRMRVWSQSLVWKISKIITSLIGSGPRRALEFLASYLEKISNLRDECS